MRSIVLLYLWAVPGGRGSPSVVKVSLYISLCSGVKQYVPYPPNILSILRLNFIKNIISYLSFLTFLPIFCCFLLKIINFVITNY